MNGAIITLIIDDIIVGDAVDLSPCRSSVAPMLNKIKEVLCFLKDPSDELQDWEL